MTELIEEECSICHGKGYQIMSAVSCLRPCNLCGGSGKTDWVSNINKHSKKEVDKHFNTLVCKKNIERLILQIKEEYFLATGLYVKIKIECIRK